MYKTINSILLSLSTIAAISQPVLIESASIAGIEHNAQLCNIDMPGQGGAAWFDYDQDGWYDLYLTGGCGRDALFHNDEGSFTEVTIAAGFAALWTVETDGVTTGDVNRDGFPDVLITTFKTSSNYLFINNGDGTFTQDHWAGEADTANSFSAAFGDMNLDGWLDLYVCNWSTDFEVTINGPIVSVDSKPNFYYQNDGTGNFIESAEQAEIGDSLGCALGVLLTDLDDDQDSDIYVANDLGYFNGNSPNQFFRNQYPLQAYSEESQPLGLDLEMNGMGMAKADIDLDGRFDYYISNIANDKLMVHGITGFEDEAVARGIKNDSVWIEDMTDKIASVGWGVAFMDLDNDMDEDLMVANGSIGYGYLLPALDSNRLYLNDGTGNFTDISLQTGIADTYVSRALAYCDYNRDGNLDVFVGVTDELDGTTNSFLYKNVSPAQNWIQVQCRGVQNNLDGIGAKVRVYSNGVVQTREIGGESSYNSQHWRVAHFGLGSNETVDSLEVYWPGGGMDTHYNPQVNEFYRATEDEGIVTGIKHVSHPRNEVYPNPFLNTISIQTEPNLSYRILDSKGALVVSFVGDNSGLKSLDTTAFTSGTYTLVSQNAQGNVVTRKLIKL